MRIAVLVKRDGWWELAGWDSTIEGAQFSVETLKTEIGVSDVLALDPEGMTQALNNGQCCGGPFQQSSPDSKD